MMYSLLSLACLFICTSLRRQTVSQAPRGCSEIHSYWSCTRPFSPLLKKWSGHASAWSVNLSLAGGTDSTAYLQTTSNCNCTTFVGL